MFFPSFMLCVQFSVHIVLVQLGFCVILVIAYLLYMSIPFHAPIYHPLLLFHFLTISMQILWPSNCVHQDELKEFTSF